MIKPRIIPVVLLRDGRIVQSRRFSRYNIIGNPTAAVERISNWSSDELIYLDITKRSASPNVENPNYQHETSEIIREIAQCCSVPLTFGGGLRTLDDARERIRCGADKVSINTVVFENPTLVDELAKEFGSQCVVVSIDVREVSSGDYRVFCGGRLMTDRKPVEFALEMQDRGAGEILLNSMDRDGTGQGFDLALISSVANQASIPVIALGGAGRWDHFAEVLRETGASAVAAANIFQHSENSVYHCKAFLFESGFPVRKPSALSSESSQL